MHMMHGYGSFWPMFLLIVFWVGLISLGIYLIANFVNGGKKRGTPHHILKERLARGEISEEEYERLRSVIEKKDV